MMRSSALRFILVVIFAAAAAKSSFATDGTVSADATVNSAHANLNFGALSNLYVGNGNTSPGHA
jgi:hypothetical protein